tara:strand:- start:3713 stop:4288 length:576 start_codon:yes stop_codon:yes gene_type:complete
MPDPFEKSFDTRAIEDLLKQSNEKLESIDKSIDYLAAAVTGEDPLGIQLGTAAYGRLQRTPRPARAEPLHRPATEDSIKEKFINIDTKLVEEVLEDMIKEELEVILTDDEASEVFGDQITEMSLNPEHDMASKIRSDIVYLADKLISSQNPEISTIADIIVKDLYRQVAWLEERLQEELGELSAIDNHPEI